jgi:hypothetical protein
VIEVRCPRCQQYWYTDEEGGGVVRLCADCARQLRRGRRTREPAGPFLFAAAGLLAVVVALIAFTAAWPRAFGLPVALFGVLLWAPGAAGLRRAFRVGHVGDVDWAFARWPALFIACGTACLLAVCTFVLRAGAR